MSATHLTRRSGGGPELRRGGRTDHQPRPFRGQAGLGPDEGDPPGGGQPTAQSARRSRGRDQRQGVHGGDAGSHPAPGGPHGRDDRLAVRRPDTDRLRDDGPIDSADANHAAAASHAGAARAGTPRRKLIAVNARNHCSRTRSARHPSHYLFRAIGHIAMAGTRTIFPVAIAAKSQARWCPRGGNGRAAPALSNRRPKAQSDRLLHPHIANKSAGVCNGNRSGRKGCGGRSRSIRARRAAASEWCVRSICVGSIWQRPAAAILSEQF